MPPPRRERQADAPIRGAIMLCEVAERSDWLEVTCGKCSRAGRLNVAKLIAQHGQQAAMTLLLRDLTAECPKVVTRQFSDPCGAHYPQFLWWFITNG